MIRKSLSGLSPTVTVLIGNVPVNYDSLSAITIDLKVDAHDMCEIVMSGVPAKYITEYISKPVYIRLDTGPSYVTEFYGTIERSNPTHAASQGSVNKSILQDTTFICFGTSYRMRGQTNRPWNSYSLAEVAKEICAKHGFSLDVPDDPTVFSTMVQSSESDWQFLVRYCGLMGYHVTVHGTHLHIFDPHKALGRMISLHGIYTVTRTSHKASPGQITSFEGKFSRLSPDGVMLDAIATVHNDAGLTYDVSTSNMLGATEDPALSVSLGVVTSNHLQAERLLLASRRSTYDHVADVTVLGCAGILPGGIVKLDRYDGEFDGLWHVNGVRHFVRTGMYVSVLDISKNNVDSLTDDGTSLYSIPPEPQLIDDVWTSSLRTVNVYS